MPGTLKAKASTTRPPGSRPLLEQTLASLLALALIAAIAWTALDGRRRRAALEADYTALTEGLALLLADPVVCEYSLKGQSANTDMLRIAALQEGAIYGGWRVRSVRSRMEDARARITLRLAPVHPWPPTDEKTFTTHVPVQTRTDGGLIISCSASGPVRPAAASPG